MNKERRRLVVPASVKEHLYAERFIDFHIKNPNVMRYLVAELDKHLRMNKKSASIKTLIGIYRYSQTMRIKGNEEYSINDAFTSLYSRLISENFPRFRHLISQKSLKNERRKRKKEEMLPR